MINGHWSLAESKILGQKLLQMAERFQHDMNQPENHETDQKNDSYCGMDHGVANDNICHLINSPSNINEHRSSDNANDQIRHGSSNKDAMKSQCASYMNGSEVDTKIDSLPHCNKAIVKHEIVLGNINSGTSSRERECCYSLH